jgi:hypothetical protein
MSEANPDHEERKSSGQAAQGYEKAVELLASCATTDGFLATTTERDTYRRIWGRDSCITGLAALLTDGSELIDCCRRGLGVQHPRPVVRPPDRGLGRRVRAQWIRPV